MQYRIIFITALATLTSARPGLKSERKVVDAAHICTDGANLVVQMQEAVTKAQAWDNTWTNAYKFSKVAGEIDNKIDDMSNDCNDLPIMTEDDSAKVLDTLQPIAVEVTGLMNVVVSNPKMHVDSWVNGQLKAQIPEIQQKCKSFCAGMEAKISGDANKASLGEKCVMMADAIDGAFKSYGNQKIQ